MKISAIVTLKKEVLDPQGKVVSQTLKNMGYQNIISVRQGKYFEIQLDETNKEKAKTIKKFFNKKFQPYQIGYINKSNKKTSKATMTMNYFRF